MTTSRRTRILCAAGAILLLTGAAGNVSAAGFALIEQNVNGLGNAYAGSAATAEDASTVFYNPAGLTLLSGTQLMFGGHVIRPYAKFNDQGSTDVTGAPLRGGSGGNAGELAFVPNLYISRALSERVSVGLGINVPFGLTTDYDPDWQGRYQGITSELMTVNINPALAFKMNEAFSVGVGVNLQYIEAKLSNAIDFGAICFGTLGPAPCIDIGLASQNADGFVKIEGDDWSWGYNVGLLFQPRAGTRIGLAYRSRIKHELSGEADFRGVPAALTAGGTMFVDTGASAALTLPETVSLSGYRELSSRWTIMGDITWTRWSRFKELRIEFDSAQPDSVTEEDWDDTLRYSLGVNYAYNDRWTWRAGIAFDETPIPNASRRTPRIPDADRWWLALGFSYRHRNDLSFDLGYAHLFLPDANIDHVGSTGDRLVGEYDLKADTVSVQMVWQF